MWRKRGDTKGVLTKDSHKGFPLVASFPREKENAPWEGEYNIAGIILEPAGGFGALLRARSIPGYKTPQR